MRKLLLFFVPLLFLLGIRLISFYGNQPVFHEREKIVLKTRLLTDPQIRNGKTQHFTVASGGVKIGIITSRFPEYSYGDELEITGTISQRLLKDGRKRQEIYFPVIKYIKESQNYGPLAIAAGFRQKTVTLFQQTLPSSSTGLLLGIVFGVKQEIPQKDLDIYRKTGVLHVVAASGMNVVLVGGALFGFFAIFFRRQGALSLAILGIMGYALIAGLEPSIVRASIMGILAFSAALIGRQALALFSLLFTAIVMLLVSPELLQDVGFQLSVLATGGIIVIDSVFAKSSRVQAFLKRSVVGEDLKTTLAAQIATMPILLANFGTYPLQSILVNLLVLWTVPILMVLGGLAVVLGFIFPLLSTIVLSLALPFLVYFHSVTESLAGFGGLVTLEEFPWQFGVAYYLLLVSLILLFRKRSESRK